jgi:microcystin-dependent protein
MTTMIMSPSPAFDILGTTGAPASGYQIFCYGGGTTTKQLAFTDSTGLTALPNPIILNTRGDVASSSVGASTGLWLDPTLTYKFVFTTPTAGDPPATSIWTLDNVVNPAASVLAALAAYEAQLAGCPIGTIVPFGGGTEPTGWHFCAGQAISRSTYSALFAIVGTTFGVGNGTTTFNLPDLRGRYPMGADNMNGSAANRVSFSVCGLTATIGNAGGSQYAQTDNITVTTGVTGPTVTVTQNAVTSPSSTPGSGIAGVGTGYSWPSATVTVQVTTAVTVTAVSGLLGTTQNIAPAQVSNYIIYAAA